MSGTADQPQRKIAAIGCGYWGKNIARAFADLGALAAVVDERPNVAREIAARHGVEALSLDEIILRADIMGVSIATPAETHCALALRALEAGKHVYVEKPIALAMPDAMRMKVAAERAGKVLMVGHLLQYHPAFEALLAQVRRGALGPLRYAYSHRLSLGKFRIEENALWSLAPHDISMLLALFDAEPTHAAATGGAYVTPGIEDEARLDLSFADGARAHVFASWLHPYKEHRLIMVGADAMAVFEDSAEGPQKLRLYRHRIDRSGPVPQPVRAEPEFIPYASGEPLLRECAHFLDCVRTGARPRTDADEALRVLRILTKAAPLGLAEVPANLTKAV